MTPTLFIDRDGTLLEEPSDYQVDRLDKIRLMPGVIPALLSLQAAGYRLVMITNQDGLGTDSFPLADFQESHDFLMRLLNSQGVHFCEVLICPHHAHDGCDCRKPNTRLADDYLENYPMDRARSAVIGDRDSDQILAERLHIKAFRIAPAGTEGLDWPQIAQTLSRPHRTAQIQRKTRETDITVSVDLDADKPSVIQTGIGFFDHMLEQIAKHSGIQLSLHCRGDLQIDEHHTVEDCALALGQALRQALGNKVGIARYGFLLAMDEAEAQVALDLSGRAYFVFEGKFTREVVGGLPTELVSHFFRSLADALGATLHLSVRGENTHHMVESCFKGVGRTLRQAFRLEGDTLPSSKGTL
jgi:imidazoleglycerol-phosphate dehydratase / histidinol-phosphatase